MGDELDELLSIGRRGLKRVSVLFGVLIFVLSFFGVYFIKQLESSHAAVIFIFIVSCSSLAVFLVGIDYFRKFRRDVESLQSKVSTARLEALGKSIAEEERADQLLTEFAAELRSGENEGMSRQVRAFIRWLETTLASAAASPANASAVIGASIPSIPAQSEAHQNIQLFANIGLYSGIIGTFFGLMLVFGSATLSAPLLQLLTGGSTGSDDATIILAGFGTAFLSSLYAYVGYLFTRTVADLTNASNDDLISYMEDQCVGSLRKAVAPLADRLRIDLPQRTIKAIEQNTRANAETQERFAALNEQVTSTSERLGAAVAEFAAVVAALEIASKRIADAVREGQRSWGEALAAWETTTREFSGSTTNIVTKIDELISRSQHTIQSLEQTGEAMQAHWQQTVRDLMGGLEQNLREYSKIMGDTREAIAGQIGGLTTLSEMHKAISKDLSDGRSQLTASFELSQSSNSAITARMEAAVNSLLTVDVSVADAVGRLSGQLQTDSTAVLEGIETLSSRLAEGIAVSRELLAEIRAPSLPVSAPRS